MNKFFCWLLGHNWYCAFAFQIDGEIINCCDRCGVFKSAKELRGVKDE